MATPSSSTFALTGDSVIDGMTHGYQWFFSGSKTINWAVAGGLNGEYWTDPSGAASLFQDVFDTYSAVANINFNLIGSGYANPSQAYSAGSDITISLDSVYISSYLGNNTLAIGLFPYSGYQSDPYIGYAGNYGDIFFNINSEANTYTYEPGAAGFALAIHEIGHTLGLKHPHDDGGVYGRPTLSSLGLSDLDIDWATVMSYEDDFSSNFLEWDPATPMVLDVLALQYLYGVNTSTNSGNDRYYLSQENLYETVYDAGGSDTIDLSRQTEAWSVWLPSFQLSSRVSTLTGYAAPYDEDLAGSYQNLHWLMGDIEHITGSVYNDYLVGSNSGNVLYGNSGNDYVLGQSGNDYLQGNSGEDYADGGNGNDTVRGGKFDDTVYGGDGNDEVKGDRGWDLVRGGDGNDLIRGGKGQDVVLGDSGNDIVMGDIGNDIVTGGTGTDTIYGGANNDLFVFSYLADSTDSERDIIQDFSQADDLIGLSGLGFTNIRSGAGSGPVLGYTQSGNATVVSDADSTFSFQLTGTFDLSSGDFVF